MAAYTDLDAVRAKKNRRRRWLRLFTLLILCLLVVFVYSYRYQLISLGVDSLLYDSFSQLVLGSAFPAEIPSGTGGQLFCLGGRLLVVDDAALSYYGASGRQLESHSHGMINPHVVASGNRALLYDRGYNSFVLRQDVREELSLSTTHPLLCADLIRSGRFVVAAPSERYDAEVTVYHPSGSKLFVWSTQELVTALALSETRDTLAAASMVAEGGQLISKLRVFDLTTGSGGECLLPGELTLAIRASTHGSYCVLTDKALLLLDEQGAVSARYEIDGPLSRFSLDEPDCPALLLGDAAGERQELVLLDAQLGLRARTPIAGRVTTLAADARGVCVLAEDSILCYDKALTLKRTLPATDARDFVLHGKWLYLLTGDSISQILR